MASDNKIIELIKQGDIAAFNTLFKSVYLQLYIHCRKFIPDPEDAKDILQNVFLRFWEKRENIDIHTSLNAYLYRAIQNECLNYLRSTGTNYNTLKKSLFLGLCLTFCQPYTMAASAQSISLNITKGTITEVFKAIEDQSEYKLLVYFKKGYAKYFQRTLFSYTPLNPNGTHLFT
ncbi:RNA polymerase sigma factor [Parabacteroides sp.]